MATVKAEAASSISRCTYHVFLSFRGEDTRKNFTDHLYTALLNAGIRTFRDDDEIERGENIELQLEKAIKESKISIIVFSKNYATSRWCLDEFVKILKRKKTDGHEVLPVFYDVEPSDVENQTGSFAEAFTRHEERINAETDYEKRKEWVEKMEGWREALKEVTNLVRMVLQNQANGHESMFIQEIVKEIGKKLKRTPLSVAQYSIGIEPRVENINLWLQDSSRDVDIGVICGMGGVGKTTIAKVLYNLNFDRFEGSSFLANIRETSEQPNGLVRLQNQLFSDILKGRKEKIYNVDEGIIKIQDAMCCRRILVVLDDVDRMEQINLIIGTLDWFHPGSKIIVTTRHNHLLKTRVAHETFKIKELDDDESFQLFSWHAFGKDHPPDGYMELSESVIRHCRGLPLPLQVSGSSFSGRRSIELWRSALEKLEAIPDKKIQNTLEMSYKSLQDDHDRNLFLQIASSFVGMDKDYVSQILEERGFYPAVGIQNLIDKSLITIDDNNKLMVHELLQDMAREIIRQESLEQPGKHMPEKDKSAISVNRAKRKHSEAFPDESVFPCHGNSLKRRLLGFLSWLPITDGLTKLFPGQGSRLGN